MSLSAEELKLIGGSDAAALVRSHPYKKPIDVFRRIIEGHNPDGTRATRRGELLEPVIRAMSAAELGLKLLGPRALRSDKYAWLRASLDDVHQGDDGEEVVEFKSANVRVADKYGDGPDDIPEEHICQTQFYMGASGMRVAHLVAFIGGDELRHYRLVSDPELQGVLFDACERFWVDHIKTGRPPPVDGSDSYSDWIDQRFTNRRADFIQADEKAEILAGRFQMQHAAVEAAKKSLQETKQRLEIVIGDASGIEGGFGRISFKRNKDTLKVDWEGLAANLNPPAELVQKYTVVKSGPRVFRPTWRKVL